MAQTLEQQLKDIETKVDKLIARDRIAITALVRLTQYHDGDCHCYATGDLDPEDAAACECFNYTSRQALKEIGVPEPPRLYLGAAGRRS